MKPTIFVIEQGEYSEYRVVGVFSSRENAELVANRINRCESYRDSAEVCEWPLDPGVDDINAGYTQWHVLMLRDGTTELCENSGSTWYGIGNEIVIWRRFTAPAYIGTNTPDILTGTIWAKDANHAIKIMNERRAQMIAEGKF